MAKKDEYINVSEMARKMGVSLKVLMESMLIAGEADVTKGMLQLCKEHTLKEKGGLFKHGLWRLETFMLVASTCKTRR